MGKILVVDDESSVLESFQDMLEGQGHEVVTAPRAEEALSCLDQVSPELVILDINLPGMNGLEAFQLMKEAHPRLPVIIMTAYGTTDSAIEATKLGAFDYQPKPFEPDDLLQTVDQALECFRLMQREVEIDPPELLPTRDALIGQSSGMQEVYKAIGRVAQSDATVLIRGETGVGKELVARAIYQHSRRSNDSLLVVNCTAIPETLLESELFGYEKGAFTGANSRRIGKFEQANGGTVLLDEIGDIPLSTQAKILRVLQEKSFQRIGGNETISVDVRVLAATNRDLERAIEEGQFREDLYHRLNVVSIHIPPLRERRDDIPKLVNYLLEHFSGEHETDKPPLSPEAMELLRLHPWPGNVRELRHCIQRVMIFTRGRAIQAENIRRALSGPTELLSEAVDDSDREADHILLAARRHLAAHRGPITHSKFMAMADRLLVTEALRMTKGNQTHAAELLGLTRPTLAAKIQKYSIEREDHLRWD